MIWVLVICLAVWSQSGHGVYHELSAAWLDVPITRDDAYFGFSVTYESVSKRLVVGAPQADTIGAIYSCDLSVNQCKSLKKDTSRFGDSLYANITYWLGATVKAGPSYVVTCAPLNLQKQTFTITGEKKTQVGTFSKCYKYPKASDEYEALKSIETNDRLRHATLFEHAMDSFGWSIDVDGEDIIIGGPAMFTGRVEKYNGKKRNVISMTGFADEKNEETKDRRINYNFGYSVVAGYFAEGTKIKTYAVGSPYGKNGIGRVSFYTFTTNDAILNNIIKSQLDLASPDEYAVGSMFGAVLCAARLTPASQASTLLVGAPTYANLNQKDYNRGAVYFYSPDARLPLKDLKRKIVAKKNNGLFGSAIAALGDYNGDDLDEIAIAAPYDDLGAGAVYIYSSKDINSQQPDITHIQRVIAAPFDGLISSFGFSLAKIEDVDENGCNELAIGAPLSNKVMIVKCIASVIVRVRAEVPKDLSLRDDNPFRTENSFTFQSCLDFSFPKKPDVIFARLKIIIKMNHPSVKLDAANKEYEEIINRTDQPICKNITVSAPKNGSYQYPIDYTITAEQLNPPEQNMKDFNASLVSLSDLSRLTTSGVISLNECKDKDHCMPELKMTTSMSVTKSYEIGSSNQISLTASVRNGGEEAYGACLRVVAAVDAGAAGVSSGGVSVAEVPNGCERDRGLINAVLCRPPDVLRQEDETWVTEIQFDTSRLTSENTYINISAAIDNECNRETSDEHNEKIELTVDLNKISIKGITDAGVSDVVDMSNDDVEGKAFEHSYLITSEGLINWANLEFKFVGENRSFIKYESIYIATGGESGLQCLETAVATEFSCSIKELSKDMPAKIISQMKIISPELLETAISDKLNTLTTSLNLKLNEKMITSSVTSKFNLGGKVKIWVIVVASLVALLILIILFVALRKCGFFKREKKTELENVRRSVRRQTMMRRTMIDGVRVVPSGSDPQSLVDSLPQETALEAEAKDKRVRLDSNATKNKVA